MLPSLVLLILGKFYLYDWIKGQLFIKNYYKFFWWLCSKPMGFQNQAARNPWKFFLKIFRLISDNLSYKFNCIKIFKPVTILNLFSPVIFLESLEFVVFLYFIIFYLKFSNCCSVLNHQGITFKNLNK